MEIEQAVKICLRREGLYQHEGHCGLSQKLVSVPCKHLNAKIGYVPFVPQTPNSQANPSLEKSACYQCTYQKNQVK